jgi:integrase
MARPSLPVGTAGNITVEPVANGGYRARCRFRDYDGVVRPVERRGKSKQAARSNLNAHLKERRRVGGEHDITPDSYVKDIASLWLTRITELVDSGARSPGTLRNYKLYTANEVLPAIGSLRVREVTVGRVDALIKSVRARSGTGAAQSTRAVVSGILGLAARHDAIERNPTRDADSITAEKPQRAARAMTLEEVALLRGKLLADETARARDLPDLVDFLLATGLRIGEAAAATWDSVDLAGRTVEVRGTVVRIKGAGLIIKPKPKSASGYRKLELPNWAVGMLEARRMVQDENDWGVIFTASRGGLIDPGNITGDLRKAFDKRTEDAAGELVWPIFDWVTSHVFRKTVLTLMDLAGLPARAAADQAGHAKVSMTQDVYFGRRVARTGAAEVLEALGTAK